MYGYHTLFSSFLLYLLEPTKFDTCPAAEGDSVLYPAEVRMIHRYSRPAGLDKAFPPDRTSPLSEDNATKGYKEA